MSRYRLVFSGDLQPGVERAECVDALAQTFKESPDRLAARLFSGKRVVVKKTDDENTAQKLMKAFEMAGGILSLETETPDQKTTRKRPTMQPPPSAPGPMADTDLPPDDQATRKREKMQAPEGFGYQTADTASDDDITRQRPAVGDEDDRPNWRRRRRRRR